MPLQITGRHMTVGDADREYIGKKIARIRRHFDHIDEMSVTIAAEKLDHVVEVNLRAGTIHVFAKTSNSNIRAAIDKAIDKIEQQVVKAKDKRSGNKKRSGRPVPMDGEE